MTALPPNLTKKIRETVNPEALLRRINYRPETIQTVGGTIKSFCPIHREPIFRTLVIEKDQWTYRCGNKQCPGANGGDLIDFYARCRGINYEEAIMEMAKVFGVEIDPKIIEDYIKQALEIGNNFMEMGVFAEAEAEYDRILRLHPAMVPALKGLLAVYKETGRADKVTQTMIRLAKALVEKDGHQDAVPLMEEYVKYNPEDVPTRLLFIQCLQKLGRKEEVARELAHLGESKAALGDIDEALMLYRRVESMGIESVNVSTQIMRILISAGRSDEAVEVMLQQSKLMLRAGNALGAIRALQSALDIDPSRDEMRVRIAAIVAQERLGGEPFSEACRMIPQMIRGPGQGHGPAAQALERLIAAFPDHPRLHDLKGDLEEARGHEEASLEARFKCVELCEKKKDSQGALEVLDKALALQPHHPGLLSRRAGLLADLGRFREAAKAYMNIIETFRSAGEYEQAAAAYQAVIELEPAEVFHRQSQFELYLRAAKSKSLDSELLASKGMGLAEALRKRNDPARAASYLERTLEFNRENSDLLTLHAETLEELNRRGEAAEQYLAAAKSLIRAEMLDQARLKVDRGLKCVPEHMELREMRADLLIKQALPSQAVREYEELSQFYLRAGEPRNVLRAAAKILSIQSDHLPAIQLLTAAYGLLGDTDQQRATQMRLVGLYREQQSFTPALELCESILVEDEGFAPAIEEMLAIAETARKSEDTTRLMWRLAQAHGNAGRRTEEDEALQSVLARDPLHLQANRRALELAAQWGSPADLAGAVDQAICRFAAATRPAEIVKILEDLRQGPFPKPEILAGLVRLRRETSDLDGVKDALRAQAQLLSRALRDEDAIRILGELAELLPEDMSIRRNRVELMLRSNLALQAADEYRLLARFHADHNQLESAESSYLEALKILPEDRELQESFISLEVRMNKHAEASRAIEVLAAQDIRREDFVAAAADYEWLLEFSPHSEDVYRKIIATHQRASNLDGALKYYDRLLDLLIEEGRSGAFEQTVHDALFLDERNWSIRQRLADHLIKVGRISEAEGVLRDMAMLQIKSELLDRAVETVDLILSLNKDSVQGRALRAELLARQGNSEVALSQFLELAGSLSELRGSVIGQPTSPFSFGNYEGLTRVKEYTFDQFVVGSRNNFAHATALAVSRAPGKNYNPLFLYSDVGLGKTHLCHAIANHVLGHHPNLKVLYTMTEDFVGALIDSIQTNTVTHFRNRYRSCDVLIIDDIQFISGKERAQEEFFHVFNALFEGSKQIVITSDRPPKEITHLEKRLRSRFGAGIIVDIQSPDLETRIAIIRKELIQRGQNADVSDEAVLCLAECIPSNIRDLKGALIQVIARHQVTREPIDTHLVHETVDRVIDRVANA